MFQKFVLRANRRWNWRRLWSCSRPANFADLEPHKPPDRNILAELRDRLRNHLADCDALVLDVVLFVQAVFFVELFHLAVGNFLDHILRLPGRQRLRAVNIPLRRQHLRRHFFTANVTWIERRNMHRDIMAQVLKRFRPRHEVRLAVNLDEHTNLPARVDVTSHEPFAGLALRFLSRGRLPLLPQNLDGLLDVSACFHKRRAAIAESRARPLAQFLYKMCRYLHSWLLCTHPFSLCEILSKN